MEDLESLSGYIADLGSKLKKQLNTNQTLEISFIHQYLDDKSLYIKQIPHV